MTDVDHAVAVASLLRDLERARVYTAVHVDGPLTVTDLADRIDDFGTDHIHDILAELSDSGFVTEADDGFDGNPVNAQIEGYEITPEVVAVVSASVIRSDLRDLREDHGLDGVIQSVSAVGDYLSGGSTWRMAVDDAPVTDAEMWEIEDVLVQVRE